MNELTNYLLLSNILPNCITSKAKQQYNPWPFKRQEYLCLSSATHDNKHEQPYCHYRPRRELIYAVQNAAIQQEQHSPLEAAQRTAYTKELLIWTRQ